MLISPVPPGRGLSLELPHQVFLFLLLIVIFCSRKQGNLIGLSSFTSQVWQIAKGRGHTGASFMAYSLSVQAVSLLVCWLGKKDNQSLKR